MDNKCRNSYRLSLSFSYFAHNSFSLLICL
uniref:Uncharacterized protein n=1 Tax=Rhizophora mucronata TaxID=61149 RepID=A0A2P2QVA6_RHIMU